MKENFIVKEKIGKNELFKISPFKSKIKKTKPHKHGNYYEVIFIESGEGFHWIDVDKYPIRAPELYFLHPGQLHCWQFTSIPKGYVLLFRLEYFNPITDRRWIEMIEAIGGIHRMPVKQPALMTAMFEDIMREYQWDRPYSKEGIMGHLQVIFSKVLMHQQHKRIENAAPHSIFDQFLVLLNQHSPKIHTVKEYAQLLHTTPQNLNASCRKNSSLSANEWINDQLILESKRYLLHTDHTVGEISALMHFNDASYFVKFFKKHVETTPNQYRLQYFQ